MKGLPVKTAQPLAMGWGSSAPAFHSWNKRLSLGTSKESTAIVRSKFSCTATKIPFMYFLVWELRGLSLNFHIHVSDSQDRSTSFHGAELADRSWEYMNRYQTHGCGNWDCGRAIPFLGICVSNFRYWFFSVWPSLSPKVNKKLGAHSPSVSR